MQASLSQSLSSLITPEVIGQASTALDEPPAAVSRAMSAVFPVLLKGLSLGVRQPRCLHTLFALATHKSNDDRLLSNVGELLAGQSPTAPTRLLGDKMLHALFGNHIGIVAPPIAEYAGIEERSSETLLHAAAQLVLADLGRRLRATGQQTPASLSQLVTREATGSVGDNVLIPAGWSMTPDNAEPGPVDRARVTSTRLTEAVRRVTSPITSRPAPENGDRPAAPRIPRIGLPAADNRREKPGSRFWTWIWLPIIGAMALAFVLLNSPDFRAWWSGTTIQASLPRPPSAGPRLDSEIGRAHV